jgi:hypothetical protein
MKEHLPFLIWFSVLCAGFALLTVMAVFHTVAVHSVGMVA